jgi:L-fucose mutarotase
MLKGIHPLLTPDLLHTLAGMGHGDEIVLCDANFPATRLGRRVIALPGVTAPAVPRPSCAPASCGALETSCW